MIARAKELHRLGDSALAEVCDLGLARGLLEAYAPRDAAQAAERARMLAFVERYPKDAHLRTRLEGHLTASALIVDAAGQRGLLTHHRKLDRWLQLGGHCDGDANLPAVALREAVEESGIEDLAIDPAVLDLDVHPIPARPGEPQHLHLDTRFVIWAPPGARFTVGEESHDLGWFSPAELADLEVDESVRRLYRLVFG